MDYDFRNTELLTSDVEAAIREALYLDLEWRLTDSMIHANELAEHVVTRFLIRTGL